jgi:iron complex outermembrane receptor protein
VEQRQAHDQPEPALFSGDIAGLGGATPPIDRERTLNAVYAELAIPIVKSLDLNLQGRYDDLRRRRPQVHVQGKHALAARAPYLFRASYNTGFRPPTLADLWLPQTLGTSEQFTDPAFPTNVDVQVPALSGGNPPAQARNVEAMAGGYGLVADAELQLQCGVFPHQAEQHHHDAVGAGSGVAVPAG